MTIAQERIITIKQEKKQMSNQPILKLKKHFCDVVSCVLENLINDGREDELKTVTTRLNFLSQNDPEFSIAFSRTLVNLFIEFKAKSGKPLLEDASTEALEENSVNVLKTIIKEDAVDMLDVLVSKISGRALEDAFCQCILDRVCYLSKDMEAAIVSEFAFSTNEDGGNSDLTIVSSKLFGALLATKVRSNISKTKQVEEEEEEEDDLEEELTMEEEALSLLEEMKIQLYDNIFEEELPEEKTLAPIPDNVNLIDIGEAILEREIQDEIPLDLILDDCDLADWAKEDFMPLPKIEIEDKTKDSTAKDYWEMLRDGEDPEDEANYSEEETVSKDTLNPFVNE